MKNKLTLILTIAGAVALFAGCTTDSPSTQQQNAIVLLESQITPVTAAATAAVLQKNPQYAADFAAGATVLDDLAGGTNVLTGAEINGLLEQRGMTNPVVATVISGELASIQTAVQSLQGTNSAVTSAQYDTWLRSAATGINSGLSGD